LKNSYGFFWASHEGNCPKRFFKRRSMCVTDYKEWHEWTELIEIRDISDLTAFFVTQICLRSRVFQQIESKLWPQ
jgi:hypothetical protein